MYVDNNREKSNTIFFDGLTIWRLKVLTVQSNMLAGGPATDRRTGVNNYRFGATAAAALPMFWESISFLFFSVYQIENSYGRTILYR